MCHCHTNTVPPRMWEAAWTGNFGRDRVQDQRVTNEFSPLEVYTLRSLAIDLHAALACYRPGDIQGSSLRGPCVPQGSDGSPGGKHWQLHGPRRFHSGKERSGSFRGGRGEVGGTKPPIRAVGCSLAPTVRSVCLLILSIYNSHL